MPGRGRKRVHCPTAGLYIRTWPIRQATEQDRRNVVCFHLNSLREGSAQHACAMIEVVYG
jgi:hypothetical protein